MTPASRRIGKGSGITRAFGPTLDPVLDISSIIREKNQGRGFDIACWWGILRA